VRFPRAANVQLHTVRTDLPCTSKRCDTVLGFQPGDTFVADNERHEFVLSMEEKVLANAFTHD
jgi:hypothetical protein